MEEKEDKNPWRYHPLYGSYKKFNEGRNVGMGRVVAVIIAVIVVIVCYFLFAQ